MYADPPGMQSLLTNPGGSGRVPGLDQVEELIHAGLSYADDSDALQPRLAEAVPSAENGLWKILPDGRMETVWTIRNGVFWQDGAPFTAADLVFSVQVNRDRDTGVVTPPILAMVESVEATDARTVVVRWKSTFIEADYLFTSGFVMPLPKHVLEQPFGGDKGGFLGVPYWRDEYIGLGPYRLQEWVPGSHLLMVATDAYVLGRPKIDQIEVRFIVDINAMIANLLSGAIAYPIGNGQLRIEQVLQIRDMTDQIRVLLGDRFGQAMALYPQFIDTNPPIVGNVEFRRALLMLIDRQELDDTINYGLSVLADSWLAPDQPEYPAVANRIVRYAYEPMRAVEIIQGLGYTRGQDGVFRDAAGQRLSLQIRYTEQNPTQGKTAHPVADYWKRAGMEVELASISPQLATNREYRVQYPAFELAGSGFGVQASSVKNYHSAQTALPENRFTGTNRARYRNPQVDSIIERYVVTIPKAERVALLGDLIHHQTDQLSVMALFYQASVAILGSIRIQGQTSGKVWNVHLWDVE